MKDKDVAVGMKVVPHAKTAKGKGILQGLENSKRWALAKKFHQPFMYVNTNLGDVYLLSDQSTLVRDGEWFRAVDFELYLPMKRTKK